MHITNLETLFKKRRLRLCCTILLITISLVFSANKSNAAEYTPDTSIETAFSPDGPSRALVLKVIQSAKKSIRLSAYSFTSTSIAHALIDAKNRDVDVAVIVDYTNNIIDDRSGKAKTALNLLTKSRIKTRTIATYPIHHDKFIIIDDKHVQTGSYNYSDSAAWRNSENVLVVWNNPNVAASYLKHWQDRFDQGIEYKLSGNSLPTEFTM